MSSVAISHVAHKLGQGRKKEDKLHLTPLKFRGNWILHLEILEFGFYPIKFEVFGFYILTFQNLGFTPLKFRVVWILHSQILKL